VESENQIAMKIKFNLEYRKKKYRFDVDYEILDGFVYLEKEISYMELEDEKYCLSDVNIPMGLNGKIIKEIQKWIKING